MSASIWNVLLLVGICFQKAAWYCPHSAWKINSVAAWPFLAYWFCFCRITFGHTRSVIETFSLNCYLCHRGTLLRCVSISWSLAHSLWFFPSFSFLFFFFGDGILLCCPADLDLLCSSSLPAWASRVSGIIGAHHQTWLGPSFPFSEWVRPLSFTHTAFMLFSAALRSLAVQLAWICLAC